MLTVVCSSYPPGPMPPRPIPHPCVTCFTVHVTLWHKYILNIHLFMIVLSHRNVSSMPADFLSLVFVTVTIYPSL